MGNSVSTGQHKDKKEALMKSIHWSLTLSRKLISAFFEMSNDIASAWPRTAASIRACSTLQYDIHTLTCIQLHTYNLHKVHHSTVHLILLTVHPEWSWASTFIPFQITSCSRSQSLYLLASNNNWASLKDNVASLAAETDTFILSGGWGMRGMPDNTQDVDQRYWRANINYFIASSLWQM